MQHSRSIPSAYSQRTAGRRALKLADHLTSILEACAAFAQCNPCDLSDEAIGSTRRAELAAITHLMQARECAHDAALEDWRLTQAVNHFLVCTQALEHAGSVAPRELMLGRRLAVTSVVQATAFLLQTCDELYLQPVPAPPPVRRPMPMRASAA